MRKVHHWTDAERDIIRMEYRQTPESRRELAGRLRVSESQMQREIYHMGLGRKSNRKPWTPEEEELLLSLVERKTVVQIAEIMNRSLNSVAVKVKKLHARRQCRNGWYTLQEVATILGMGHHWVMERIENGALRARKHHLGSPDLGRGGAKTWHIEEGDLREFIRRYPQELNGRNVDTVQVVEILAGLLPQEGSAGRGRIPRDNRDRPALCDLGIRTPDGALAFGFDRDPETRLESIVMFSQDPGCPGAWMKHHAVSVETLAELMERKTQNEGNQAAPAPGVPDSRGIQEQEKE